MIRHWGKKTAQGRYWSEKMDNKALAAWLYGFLRNETATPEDALKVLLQVLCHLHNQNFDMYNPRIPKELLNADGKFNYDGYSHDKG